MPTLTLVQSLTTALDTAASRITDLALRPSGTGSSDTLYGTTRYDGGLTAWKITGAQLTQLDRDTFATGAVAGAIPGLSFVDRGGITAILSGGAAGGGMALRDIASTGHVTGLTPLSGQTKFAGTLVQPVNVDLGAAGTGVYGGVQGGAGVAQMVFNAASQLVSTSIANDTTATFAKDVTATATATIGSASYVLTASTAEVGVTAWRVLANGTLKAADSAGTTDGLWINAPTAMATAEVGGTTYLVLAAAGSGSLSVLEVGTDGSLSVATHILDDLHTRFAGATALTTLVHDGQTYVIAGGADDGISVFSILPGGILLHRTSIADTVDMTAANVSAIAAQSRGTGFDIFVASGTEAGISQLRYELGTTGTSLTATSAGGAMAGSSGADMLIGGAGADRITGGAGDDVLTDGAGTDTLTGGSGADIFVMDADNQADTITDFQVGVDRVDLAGWPNLRSIDQLELTPFGAGIRIAYGQDVLTLYSHNGQSIAKNALSDTDLIGPARLPQVAQSGFPGPGKPDPTLPDRALPEIPVNIPAEMIQETELFGDAANNTLRGTDVANMLWGMDGADRLYGEGGADLIFAGNGHDILWGQDGDDMLYGGGGRDVVWTKPMARSGWANNDQLYGGNGNDQLFGQAGADRLDGGAGDDILSGGAGRDTFVFAAGDDHITDFCTPLDQIHLDDALWSGTRDAHQVISRFAHVQGNSVVFDFENGNTLTLDSYTGIDTLGDALVIF